MGGVEKIILPLNPSKPIANSHKFDFCAPWLQQRPADVKLNTSILPPNLFDKFGYAHKSAGFDYVRNQMFKMEDLWPLVCELQQKKEKLRPLVAWRTLETHTNAWWGISGGFKVDLLVIIKE